MNTKARGQQLANNLSAVVAPTVNDDVTLGYYIESQWFDTVTKIFYICEDNTTGAAIWTPISGSGGGGGVCTNGIDTKDVSDASVVQNIAHGLGVVPSKIKLSFLNGILGGTNIGGEAFLSYNGTTVSVVGQFLPSGGSGWQDASATDIKIYDPVDNTKFQEGVVTFDATNIIITWTKTSNPSGIIYRILWEACDGGAASSQKKVGVGEPTDIAWMNFQYQFGIAATQADSDSVWLNSGANPENPMVTNFTVADYFREDSAKLVNLFPIWATFDAGKQMIFQIVIEPGVTSAGINLGGVGFDQFGTVIGNSIMTAQGTNTLSVGFVRKDADGTWYSRSSDGVTFTENLITIADGNRHVLRCEYDPGNATPQARFYVDGVLVDTITTDIPSAIPIKVGFGCGNGGAADLAIAVAVAPSFAVEI